MSLVMVCLIMVAVMNTASLGLTIFEWWDERR